MKIKKNKLIIGMLNAFLFILVFSNFLLSGLTSDATTDTSSGSPDQREGRLDVYSLIVHVATYFWFYLIIFIISVLLFIVVLLWRYSKLKEFPVIWVTGEDSESKKLGKVVESKQSKRIPNFYEIRVKKILTEEDYLDNRQDRDEPSPQKYFKTSLKTIKKEQETEKEEKEKKKKKKKSKVLANKEKDYMTCYCLQHFAEMQQYRWRRQNWGVTIWDYLPSYQEFIRPLPPSLWFKKKELKNTLKNKVLYGLFLVAFKSQFIHKHLEYVETDESVKEIILLIHQLQVERKKFLFQVTYERKETIQGISTWVKYPEIKLMSIEDPDQEGKQYFLEDMRLWNQDKDGKKIINRTIPREMKKMFRLIFVELVERKREMETLIKHGVLKEKERELHMSLSQIDALSKNPDYRKVQRKGDPIVEMVRNKNLREAATNQEHYSELQANFAIATAEKDARIRELERELHNTRDALIQLDLKVPSLVDKEVLKFIDKQKEYQPGRLDLVARALYYANELGYDQKDAIIAALKDEKVSEHDEKLVARLMKEIEIRDTLIDRIAPQDRDGINISLPRQNAGKTIRSRDELLKLKEELKKRGDGGNGSV